MESYPTSAAARAAALKLVAEHPGALEPATVERVPGLDARYLGAVRLRPGANLTLDVDGISVLRPDWKPAPKPVSPPKPKVATIRRPRRGSQRDLIIALLSRPEGVTTPELVEALDVLPHTARAMLSVIRRDVGVRTSEDRRRYWLANQPGGQISSPSMGQ